MILRFPKGYDTPIGEAGQLLSGGQRQRIGLARAVYDDPVLVVLDEPNANLDDVGETALVHCLELKTKGRTVFPITHRPGIVAVADRVLILRNGMVQADVGRATRCWRRCVRRRLRPHLRVPVPCALKLPDGHALANGPFLLMPSVEY